MLAGILLTIQIIVGLTMGALILIQRSEGGALGMGGGPSGLVSARGAGNLLTRATAILAVIFFINSIGLTVVGNLDKKSQSAINSVDTTKITQAPVAPTQGAEPVAQAETASRAAPSLSDLPLATAPTGQVSAETASTSSATEAKPSSSAASK